MRTEGWCGQVGGTTNLSLQTIGRPGTYLPGPPKPTGTKQAKPVRLSAFTGASLTEIERRIKKIVTAFLIDRSGSMYNAWGGDPSDVCGAAVESVFGLLRRSGGGRAV